MKKQLFSFVMMLAIVVLAGTSAFAQANGLSVGTAIWHLPGSTHGFAVTDAPAHTGTTFTWAIASVGCDGITAGGNAAQTITAGADPSTASVTYTDDATGMYRITCTESANGCSTIREFFTAIMDINVVMIATDNAGDEITGGALSSCNDYSLATMNGSNLVGNDNADDNSNDLNAWQNPALYNLRWVEATLTTSDESGCAVANAPAAGSFAWRFDYTISGTNYDAGDNFIQMDLPATATNTTPTAVTGTIEVARGTTTILLALRSYIRWGTTATDEDQEFAFAVNSNSTDLDDDATLDYTDGTEPVANNTDNTSATQHIDASPATPRIVVTD